MGKYQALVGTAGVDQSRAGGPALRGLPGPWSMRCPVPGAWDRVTERRSGDVVKVSVSAWEGLQTTTVLMPYHSLGQSCHWVFPRVSRVPNGRMFLPLHVQSLRLFGTQEQSP